jgi:hypothetical protein
MFSRQASVQNTGLPGCRLVLADVGQFGIGSHLIHAAQLALGCIVHLIPSILKSPRRQVILFSQKAMVPTEGTIQATQHRSYASYPLKVGRRYILSIKQYDFSPCYARHGFCIYFRVFLIKAGHVSFSTAQIQHRL